MTAFSVPSEGVKLNHVTLHVNFDYQCNKVVRDKHYSFNRFTVRNNFITNDFCFVCILKFHVRITSAYIMGFVLDSSCFSLCHCNSSDHIKMCTVLLCILLF